METIREYQWEGPLKALFVYYLLAALVVGFVHHQWCSKHRDAHPRRYRVIFALVLAIVFTPSLISDFFLFGFPGPAILELLLLLPAAIVHPWPFLYVATIVCFVPLMAGFSIFYFALWIRDRQRSKAANC